MNKFKGLSTKKKIGVIIISIMLLMLVFGVVKVSSQKIMFNRRNAQSDEIEQALNDFTETKPEISSNVDLNDVDKIDKNTKIKIKIPLPKDTKYNFYYDENADDEIDSYVKINKEFEKEISILDLNFITGIEEVNLNGFIATDKNVKLNSKNEIDDNTEYHLYSDTGGIEPIKVPIKKENIDKFKDTVFKLQAAANAEKYDLNEYLEKKLDIPFEVTGTVYVEEGSQNNDYTVDKSDIFRAKYEGDDYTENTIVVDSSMYSRRGYMIDDRTGLKISIVSSGFYTYIDYPSDYEGEKENILSVSEAKDSIDSTFRKREIGLAENNNNGYLKYNQPNKICSTSFRLIRPKKEYSEDSNYVLIGENEDTYLNQ